jgi:hypothetical protein
MPSTCRCVPKSGPSCWTAEDLEWLLLDG